MPLASGPFTQQGETMRSKVVVAILGVILSLGGLPARAQGKKVVLNTLDWEPYIGEKLPGKGYVFEIVSEAFKSAGYQVEIRFVPWARAVDEGETGHVDGIFPEYMDEGRLSHFIYSASYPGGPLGFLARKDSKIVIPGDLQKDQTRTLQGMKQYSFGVVRDYVNTKEFDGASFLKKDVADSDEQNIRKLQAKRSDLIVIDKFVAQYVIKSKMAQFSGELEFLEPPLEIKPLYVLFSKKAPGAEQKVKDFNDGLARLQKSGAIKAILKKYGF